MSTTKIQLISLNKNVIGERGRDELQKLYPLIRSHTQREDVTQRRKSSDLKKVQKKEEMRGRVMFGREGMKKKRIWECVKFVMEAITKHSPNILHTPIPQMSISHFISDMRHSRPKSDLGKAPLTLRADDVNDLTKLKGYQTQKDVDISQSEDKSPIVTFQDVKIEGRKGRVRNRRNTELEAKRLLQHASLSLSLSLSFTQARIHQTFSDSQFFSFLHIPP